MIAQEHIKKIIDEQAQKMDLFIVDIKISPSAMINVFVDSMKGVTIEQCSLLSSAIKDRLDIHIDDYALEVSSPGLDKPLILPVQFEKNLGRSLDVVTKDGHVKTGRLVNVFKKGIEIETEVPDKNQSGRKKKYIIKKLVIDFNEIKSAKVVVSFN
jgi:ribosome maturation factor RimP